MLFLLQIITMLFPKNEVVEPQAIFQLLLDTERLQNIIKAESLDDKQLPIIITNGYLSTNVDLTMFGEKVKLFESKAESELVKSGHPYINLSKSLFNTRKGSAEFIMTYRKIYIKAKFEKIEDEWQLKYFYNKKRKNRFLEFNF